MSDLIFHAGGECYDLYGTLSKRTSSEEDIAETFTRTGGNAYYIDRNGQLKIAEANVLRTEWTGSSFDTPATLVEGARTNVALWDRDMTNAAWTKSTCTAAKDQTGVDGAATSASSLTATDANATCLQAITLGSSARYQSVYIKRITGSGTIEMTMDNGSTWTAVTVTSEWTRVTIPTQTLANPTVGFRIVTDTDAIAVDFAQNEDGTFESAVIATTTVAVTRNTEACSLPFAAPPQGLTLYVKFEERGDKIQGDTLLSLSDSSITSPYLVIVGNSSNYYGRHHNGSALVTSTLTSGGPAIGDTEELRVVLGSDGSVQTHESINAAAETSATATAANALAAAWSGNLLWLGPGAASYGAFQSIKIARGTKTLAEMRALGV